MLGIEDNFPSLSWPPSTQLLWNDQWAEEEAAEGKSWRWNLQHSNCSSVVGRLQPLPSTNLMLEENMSKKWHKMEWLGKEWANGGCEHPWAPTTR